MSGLCGTLGLTLVSWRLANGLPHTGVVIDAQVPNSKRRYVVHNIGRGPEQADVLFTWRMTGHFRFLPANRPSQPAVSSP